jgi:hypothetical protein
MNQHLLRLTSNDWKRFVEVPSFTSAWQWLGLTDDDLRSLQLQLVASPEAGAVVRDSNGLRKLRFAPRGRGKRGAFRIGYVYFHASATICLLAVYAKNDKADLTADERRGIKKLIDYLRDWVQL